MNDNKAFLISLISKYNEVDLGVAEDMLMASVYRNAEYLNLAARKAIEEIVAPIEETEITEENVTEEIVTEENVVEETENVVSPEIEQPTIEKVEDESAE